MSAMIDEDSEHLRLLAIFHYVVGGMGLLFSCFPIIHLVVGIVLLVGGFPGDQGKEIPEAFAWFFIVFAGLVILIGGCVSGCILLAGKWLQRRRNYTYCLVIACIECTLFPFGTVLGVFSIVVLNRTSVREMFAANKTVQA